MIMQPSFVDPGVIEEAMVETKWKRKLAAIDQLRLEEFTEGRSAQVLHVGPFSEERPTIEHVSPGSTPGARYDVHVPRITETRPGTYVFNDRNTIDRWAATEADCALTVLTTVVSRPSPDRAIIDAGNKVLSSDPVVSGDGTFGLVVGRPDLKLGRLSEEHGILSVDPADGELRVGDRLHVIPNHVCPAVNLSDVLYGYRDGRGVREIPVIARGKYR